MYNGNTDDMLVFDRCNRLVKHLKLPEAIANPEGGVVKDAIKQAYDDSPCGNDKTCSRRPKKKTSF
jgi:hypothetical protein